MTDNRFQIQVFAPGEIVPGLQAADAVTAGIDALEGRIAGAIWVSSITRQHVHLDDGTVWVTSLKNRKAARFNVKLKEPDSAVASSAARFDIVQHDSDTVLTEGAKATGISSATLGTTGRTETKGDTTAVTGGGTIAFLNTKNGNVWVGRSSDLNSVNPATSDPSMRLGTGGKIAVTHDGTVYGYRPSDGTVLTMQDPTGKAVQGGSLTEGKTVSADDFTVVDGTAVVTSEGRLYWHKGSADTGASPDAASDARPGPGEQRKGGGWRSGVSLIQISARRSIVATGAASSPAGPRRPTPRTTSTFTPTSPSTRATSAARRSDSERLPQKPPGSLALASTRIAAPRGIWPEASSRPSRSVSARAAASSLNWPRTAEVVVRAPGLRIPRIAMHRCSASITSRTGVASPGSTTTADAPWRNSQI